MIKRILSLMLSLCMLAFIASAAPAVHTSDHPSPDPVDSLPRRVLGQWDLDTGDRGTDETSIMTLERGEGTYLRWYCDVSSYSAPVHVYLYDIGKGEIVSAMSPYLEPGEERTEVYNVGSDSPLCQFRIMIESTNGATGRARVRANQIKAP